jgi:predicted DNA-binding WGR domain protein
VYGRLKDAGNPDKYLYPNPNNTIPGESSMKRYFEFVSGTSSKFWETCVSGNEVTVRFGRIGTDGQTQVKTQANAEAAVKHAEKLIEAKTAKGYLEKVAR